MFKLAMIATAVQGVSLKKKSQAPFGDQDDAYVADTAERNAMYDCSGGAVAPGTKGASNDMAMRIMAAKTAAIAGDDPTDLKSFKKSVKRVQKFQRYAGQDCEENDEAPVKKDMTNESPFVKKMNFHGPGSQVEKANDLTRAALEKVVQIKQEVLGDQFARVEDAPAL